MSGSIQSILILDIQKIFERYFLLLNVKTIQYVLKAVASLDACGRAHLLRLRKFQGVSQSTCRFRQKRVGGRGQEYFSQSPSKEKKEAVKRETEPFC